MNFLFHYLHDLIQLNKPEYHNSLPVVLYFYEPGEIKLNDFSPEYIQKEIDTSEFNETVKHSLSLNGTQKLLYERYNNCIIHAAIISEKQKPEWSSPFSLNLK